MIGLRSTSPKSDYMSLFLPLQNGRASQGTRISSGEITYLLQNGRASQGTRISSAKLNVISIVLAAFNWCDVIIISALAIPFVPLPHQAKMCDC